MNTNAIANKTKAIVGACITFICLLFTQFLLPVNLAGNVVYLYYIELFIIALFTAAFIFMLVKKSKLNLSKKEIAIMFLFVAWFAVLTVYRFFVTGNITGGFIVFRVLTFPIILMLIFKQYQITKQSVFWGLFAFITYINIYQIISVIFISKSFRLATALANINIYICFALAVLPLLLYFVSKYKCENKAIQSAVRIAAVFNIVCVVLFSLYSGSRIAVLLCPVIGVISYFFINKFTKKSILTFLASVVAMVVLISTMFVANIYDAKYNFFRVVDPFLSIFHFEFDFGSDDTNSDDPTHEHTKPEQNKPGQSKPGQNKPGQSKPEKDEPEIITPEDMELAQTSVADSNGMRGALWEKSIYYIKQNPIFGRHSIDIDCQMTFVGAEEPVTIVGSPHNFILEMWLALGLPGMLIYFAIILLSVAKILFAKISVGKKVNFMLIMLSIFGFSFFQPLVTCWFAISMTLWISMYFFTSDI